MEGSLDTQTPKLSTLPRLFLANFFLKSEIRDTRCNLSDDFPFVFPTYATSRATLNAFPRSRVAINVCREFRSAMTNFKHRSTTARSSHTFRETRNETYQTLYLSVTLYIDQGLSIVYTRKKDRGNFCTFLGSNQRLVAFIFYKHIDRW